MAMSPSPGHDRGKATGESTLHKKASAEPPLLQQLLPKATLQLASSLSSDDKEVLAYLVLYGRQVLFAMVALSSACKSPWKPWKYSSSKASRRQQVFPSCSTSDSCMRSFISSSLAEELSSKKSPSLHVKDKASFTCDCFSCYSSFWSRWNTSPNRDLINEILDVIENSPQNSKGKKKKKADKKRVGLENEACSEKNVGRDDNEQVHMSRALGLNDEWSMPSPSNDGFSCTDMSGKAFVASTSKMDGASHANIMGDEALTVVTQLAITGCKKRLFKGIKQKEPCTTNSRSLDLRCKVSGANGIENEALSVLGIPGERAAASTEGAVAIALPMSLTIEASEAMDVGLSLASCQGKSAPKLQQYPRIGKRRSNQVTPLDCEAVLAVEKGQEAVIMVENAEAPVSPRAADIGLGGRGFLARVFPDALGRVASRLWDLVSVRLRSRTVEYH